MIRYLIQKEFLQIRRNAFLPRLIVMFPIMIMCVMPWVMNMEVKNIVVEVVDTDHTVESQRLIQQDPSPMLCAASIMSPSTREASLTLLYQSDFENTITIVGAP